MDDYYTTIEEVIAFVGADNAINGVLFDAFTWEPTIVRLVSPYCGSMPYTFVNNILEHVKDRYAYQPSFDWFNDSVRLAVDNDIQYVVLHSLAQHVPASKNEHVKNHRVSSMTGNGGIWYGSVLVLRLVDNIVDPWDDASEDMASVTKELERYVRRCMQHWLDEPYTMALNLREWMHSDTWHTLYGSQLGMYSLIEAGIKDKGGIDGLDHVNERRLSRYELNE